MRNKKLIAVLIVICSITLLIVLNSVIFSVREVTAYCYNEKAEDVSALSDKVVRECGIKHGGSIFTLNKEKVVATLTKNVPEIKVINVEKKFPNKISINYVKIYEWLRIEKDGDYYFCSNDGIIMRKDKEKGPDDSVIELRLSRPISNTEQGEPFASDSAADVMLTSELLSVLEWRLGYPHEALVKMIRFIDISKNRYVYIGMEAGVVIELQGTGNIAEKLRSALSIYENGDIDQSKGTIVIPDGGGVWSYDPNDRYKEIMS